MPLMYYAAFVFRQEDLQRFPNKAERTEHIRLVNMLQPLVIRLVDYFLLADCGVIDNYAELNSLLL